jgi:hypothetical protein
VTLFWIILEADQCTGPGGGCVSELNDSIRDPAPCRRAVLLLGGSEFVGACRTFLKRSTEIALEPLSISGITPPKCTVAVDKV